MGYQIMYSPEDNHKYPAYKPKSKNRWLFPVVITIALLVAAGIPNVRNSLERWLIPGDAQVTKAAFSAMLDQLRTGEPIDEAVTAFCREIIAGGKTEEILDT